MRVFYAKCERWRRTVNRENLRPLLNEKLAMLLQDPSEKGVSSCIALLRSFGEDALSHVLCVNGDQLELRSDLGIKHPNLWGKKLLELFCKERSPWYELYKSDAFRGMLLRVGGEIEWGSLSPHLQ